MTGFYKPKLGFWARLLSDKLGAIGMLYALLFPILLGFVALGVEVGLWYFEKRSLQTAADVSAIAAAYELAQGTGLEQIVATREAERHGVDTNKGDVLQINHPPTSGRVVGDNEAVEVIIERNENLLFSSVIMSGPIKISARAVAKFTATGTACVLALNRSASSSIDFGGTADVDVSECLVAANSNSAEAITIRGKAVVKALSLTTAGDYHVVGSGSLVSGTPPQTGAPIFPDPYADTTIPEPGICNVNSFVAGSGGVVDAAPGTYCNGMKFVAGSVTNFQPGVYVVNGGAFDVAGQAVITCPACIGTEGVTIILTGSGSNYATMSINGGAQVSLQAPYTGPYAGILIMQDRGAPYYVANLNGGSTTQLDGALYFKNQKLIFNGNNKQSGSCLQLVADTIEFTGTSYVGNDCTQRGVKDIIIQSIVRLIE